MPGATPEGLTCEALVFDVFGTVVDWRGSLIRETAAIGRRAGVVADWERLVDDWRGAYQPSMQRVRSGELPWTKLDALHRLSLDRLVAEHAITGFSEADLRDLVTAWHRLAPWPDAVAGMTRLRRRFLLATMSNGNVGLLTRLAKNGGLPFDCILGAEPVRHYKPDPETYLSACEFLDLPPERIMLVAAHRGDLDAARAVGLRTGFVHRPDEYVVKPADTAAQGEYDAVADDFGDLADRLGA